jgi:pyridoxine kinase
LATSIPASDTRLANVLMTLGNATACTVQREAAPHGTGDLLAALYLGRILNASCRLQLAAAAAASERHRRQHGPERTLASTDALWANVRPLPTAPV